MECICLMESLKLSLYLSDFIIYFSEKYGSFLRSFYLKVIKRSERNSPKRKCRACEHFQAILQEEIVFRMFGISIVKNAVVIKKWRLHLPINVVMLVVEIKNTFIFGSRVEKIIFRPLT